jgi:hypothetical protein
MSESAAFRAVAVALPALVLGGMGLTHPIRLTAGTAWWWMTLHVLLLPVFPLLAAALWLTLDRAAPALRVVGRVAAFGFAVFYDGLDAVDGIAAGAVVHAHHEDAASAIFTIGDRLGHWGSWCFLVASVAVVAAAALRSGWTALPGAAFLLPAAVSFLDSHIFWPRGVLTMLAVAIGMALLTLAGGHGWTSAFRKAPEPL